MRKKTFKKKKVQVFDVTGAGDSFIGIIAHLLNLGYNLEKSTEISSLCCSIIVTKKYTSVLNVEEFNDTLNLLNQNKNSIQNKLDGKFETIKKWKKLGVELPTEIKIKQKTKAALISPDGKISPKFLVFDNYEKVLKWNRSLRFGISVCKLANMIKNDI